MYTKNNLAADIVDLFDEFLAKKKILRFLAPIQTKKLRDITTVIVLVYTEWNIGDL